MCSSVSWCVNRGEFSRRFNSILHEEATELDDLSKGILRERYMKLVDTTEIAAKRSAFCFMTLSTITTIGSILVPALIAIQEKPFNWNTTDYHKLDHENKIYWSGWGISLIVTLSNGLVRLFSFDKTYITRKLRNHHLKSEGWLFLQLSGKYSCFETHQEAFSTFCNTVEKIRSEQVKEEFTFDNNIGHPSFSRGHIVVSRRDQMVSARVASAKGEVTARESYPYYPGPDASYGPPANGDIEVSETYQPFQAPRSPISETYQPFQAPRSPISETYPSNVPRNIPYENSRTTTI